MPSQNLNRRTVPTMLQFSAGAIISDETILAEAVAALLARDPETVGLLVEVGGFPPLRRRSPDFSGLAAIIVSQQVSVASAEAVFGRLVNSLQLVTAETLLEASEATLRGCGLSRPKIRALTAVAEAVSKKQLDLAALASISAVEAHCSLTAVYGIGPWTADIFLLSCVGHPDAFPAGDLALQEAARLALNLPRRPDALALEAIAERWRPYRGVAARMLWAYYQRSKAARISLKT